MGSNALPPLPPPYEWGTSYLYGVTGDYDDISDFIAEHGFKVPRPGECVFHSSSVRVELVSPGKPERGQPLKCDAGCGAPLKGKACAYCGTRYW